jgi:hypothetical protein
MIGVVSGVNGHLAALSAVLADGKGRGVTTWVSLGESVGLFSEWAATLDMFRGFSVTLRGWGEEHILYDGEFIGSAFGRINAIKQTRRDMSDTVKRAIRAWPTEATLDGVLFRSWRSGTPSKGIVVGACDGHGYPDVPGIRRADDGRFVQCMDSCHVLPIPGADYLLPGMVALPRMGHRPAYLVIDRARVEFIRLPPCAIPDYVSNRSPAYLAMA